MNSLIATATVELVDRITRSLIGTGALHKSEQTTIVQILKRHTPGAATNGIRDDLLTVGQTAQEIRLSKKTVLRMIKSGELKGVYLRPGSPKTLRIRRSSIDAVLAGEGGDL